MEQLLTNARFANSFHRLPSFKREKVINNFEKLLIENPDIKPIVYIAILDKLYKKDVSYIDISAGTYMSAVDTWNKFIVDSRENFDLLISGEDLVF